MTELDFFGHWGYFFLFVGLFYIGAKERVGWLFRFFGEIIWIYLGFVLGLTSVWGWGFVFLSLDIYNYRKWKATNETKQCESQGPDLATERSSSRKKKVQPARRRRSVKTDGKRRSGSNAKPKGTKGARRNVRVQKDNRRTNAKGT